MIPIYDCGSKKGVQAIERLLARQSRDYADKLADVETIVADVKQNGDAAVYKYTKQFDGADLAGFGMRVSESEIDEARGAIGSELASVFKESAARIANFNSKRMTTGWIETFAGGEIMGQLVRPLERVGIYTPGGEAPLASSLLMCAVPAKAAGVKEIVLATPPNAEGRVDPAILAAAAAAGVTEIYKAGGAQAIAMLAYGTKSVKKVDKIAGPGNIYVTLAKKCVYGQVDVDSIAGPSEIVIIADDSAKPAFIAADIMAQAEHGEPAPALVFTTSDRLAVKVVKELEIQLKEQPRRDVIKRSLTECGFILVAGSLREAVRISDSIAPEHLELCVKNPLDLVGEVKNAGAIFMGNYTPEALGDYMAGPSHVLPTGGTARFFSPLTADDFLKKSSVLSFNKRAFNKLSGGVRLFAEAEGLAAHANSINIRR